MKHTFLDFSKRNKSVAVAFLLLYLVNKSWPWRLRRIQLPQTSGREEEAGRGANNMTICNELSSVLSSFVLEHSCLETAGEGMASSQFLPTNL